MMVHNVSYYREQAESLNENVRIKIWQMNINVFSNQTL